MRVRLAILLVPVALAAAVFIGAALLGDEAVAPGAPPVPTATRDLPATATPTSPTPAPQAHSAGPAVRVYAPGSRTGILSVDRVIVAAENGDLASVESVVEDLRMPCVVSDRGPGYDGCPEGVAAGTPVPVFVNTGCGLSAEAAMAAFIALQPQLYAVSRSATAWRLPIRYRLTFVPADATASEPRYASLLLGPRGVIGIERGCSPMENVRYALSTVRHDDWILHPLGEDATRLHPGQPQTGEEAVDAVIGLVLSGDWSGLARRARLSDVVCSDPHHDVIWPCRRGETPGEKLRALLVTRCESDPTYLLPDEIAAGFAAAFAGVEGIYDAEGAGFALGEGMGVRTLVFGRRLADGRVEAIVLQVAEGEIYELQPGCGLEPWQLTTAPRRGHPLLAPP